MKIKELNKTYCSSKLIAASAMVFLIAVLHVPDLFGNNRVVLDDVTERLPLNSNIDILEDKESVYDIKDIISSPLSETFVPIGKSTPNYGYSKSAYWARITFSKRSKKTLNDIFFLEFEYPLIDYLEFYEVQNKEMTSHISTGDRLNFDTRKIEHQNYIFRIDIDPQKEKTYYFRIKSEGSVRVPLTLYSLHGLMLKAQRELWEFGLFYGILIIMLVYNLFLLLLLRDKSYLYFVAFAISYGLFQLTLDGFAFQYLWPDSVRWGNTAIPVFGMLCGFTIILFGNSFLVTNKNSPLFHKIMLALMALFSVSSMGALLVSYRISLYIVTIFVIVASLSFLYAGFSILIKGNKFARFYVLAWSCLFVFTILFSFSHMGILPMNYFTDHGIKIGVVLLIIFLSFALGDQINEEKREKFAAQEEALANIQIVQKTEQNALEMLKKTTELLEQKVSERTCELQETYERLNKAYSDMKEDLLLAKTIQDKILPKNLKKIKNLGFHIEYLPLIEIGGDFYDIYQSGANTIRIFLADATGHGIVAALIIMLIKNEYDKLKDLRLSPFEVFDILNQAFIHNYDTLNMFFTGIIIDVDTANGTILYSSAGCPDQYILRGDGLIPLSRTGRAVGIMGEINCVNKEVEFHEGDRILLFTDGFFEEFNQDMVEYGEERLIKTIKENIHNPIDKIIDTVIEDIVDFIDESEFHDDITVIGIE